MDFFQRLRNQYRLGLSALFLGVGSYCGAQTAQTVQPAAVETESADEVVLDLETIYELIEKENFTVLINREAIEDAFQRSIGSRSFLYPQLDAAVQQTRQKAVTVRRKEEGRNLTPHGNRFDAKLVANYNILNANLLAEYRLAQVGHRIAQLSYEAILQNIQAEAGRLYFLHLRNLRRLDVIYANIERDRALLDLAKNQLEVGVATQIDVTRAESRLANDQIELLRQQQAIRESSLNLKRMLNLHPDSGMRLVEWAEPVDETHEVRETPLGIVLENRFDYKVEQEQMSQARLTRRAADWQNFPSLSLFGEYGLASGYAFDDREETAWMAGIQVVVPVFEGFRIRSDRLRADSQLRSQEYVLRDKESEIRTEYRLAISDIHTRFDQIALARKQLELGEQELQLARNRFEQGVADNREVVDAQAVLAAANDQLVEAVYLYNLSQLYYAAVRGNPRLILSE